MCRIGYARILVHYPYIVVLAILLVAGTCLVITLTLGKEFNFEDPLAGFEPRGTETAARLVTYENLLNNVGDKANLYPFSPPHYPVEDHMLNHYQTSPTPHQVLPQPNTPVKIYRRHARNDTGQPKRFFCAVPDKIYSRLVVTSSTGRSLFNVEDLQAMCSLEDSYFHTSPMYQHSCLVEESTQSCCTAWSLGSYVALLSQKPSCQNITTEDVDNVLQLLIHCAPYFHNLTLVPNCVLGKGEWYHSPYDPYSLCSDVPPKCRTYNAVYHMLHFLSDSNFMNPPYSSLSLSHKSKLKPVLKFAVIFLPVATGSASADLFQHLDNLARQYRNIKIVGAHFGVKYILFQRYLILDSVWLAAACGVIFIAMWLYTTSIFVTIMTFLSMFLAVEVAYFLYTFVFNINFFPYMNMVTLIVMIGVGADDLFIYCKVWHLAKLEKNNGVLEKITGDTLKHTALSMMVTSLTTAAAFYANMVSDISAIRCFSVFAGTTMVINFFLTVTWLPASIMIYEKWCHCCVVPSDHNLIILSMFCKFPLKLYNSCSGWSRIFFEKLLPCLVIKFRYVWIITFGGLWIGSIIIIFYQPGLKLPDTHKFQVFSSNHLLEKYEFELSEMFQFEHLKDSDELPVFPVTVVWGVLATDSGDPLDPYERGSLTFDPHFDITTKKAQKWILTFCSNLRKTDFFLPTTGFLPPDCFFENFVHHYMTQSCNSDNHECCNDTRFPYPKSKMMSCLSKYIPELRATPFTVYNDKSPGPRFDNGRISAFFVQFLSNYTFTHAYEDTQSFYTKVNQWVKKELQEAPPELQNGWFVSHFHFYDLQTSLAVGTPLSMGVSLCIVAIVSFFTTLNVLVSLYAVLSVSAAISVTLASLVLLDWKLDMLESVVITVAIGLAIDLTLHYGVAFRLAPDSSREMRVISSIGRMGSPVTMAAVSTFLAGAFMMPSTILAYRKFGTFLLLLVSAAWLYATFFFMSLLRLLGPHGGFGQFHWPVANCFSSVSREHIDKTTYALSESTMSSSTDHSHYHSGEHDPAGERHTQCFKRSNVDRNNLDHDYRRPGRHHHHHHSHRHIYHQTRRKGEYVPVQTEESNADSGDIFAEMTNTLPFDNNVILNPCNKDNLTNATSESKESDFSLSGDCSIRFLHKQPKDNQMTQDQNDRHRVDGAVKLKQTQDLDNLLLKQDTTVETEKEIFPGPESVM